MSVSSTCPEQRLPGLLGVVDQQHLEARALEGQAAGDRDSRPLSAGGLLADEDLLRPVESGAQLWALNGSESTRKGSED